MTQIGFCDIHRRVTRNGCDACMMVEMGIPRWLAAGLDVVLPLVLPVSGIAFALYIGAQLLMAWGQSR